MRDMKKILMSGLAVGLLVSISITSTLAYLKAGGDQKRTVTNTFVALDGLVENEQFSLKEHVYNSETGQLTSAWLADGGENEYSYLVPEQTLPKDPTLTLNLKKGARAYVFVKMTNDTYRTIESDRGFNILPGDGTNVNGVATGWTYLSGLSNEKEKVFYYSGSGSTNGVVAGVDGVEINGVPILKDNKVRTNAKLGDTNVSQDGMQLGQLKFQAFVCQAQGFESSPESAFRSCFSEQVPKNN